MLHVVRSLEKRVCAKRLSSVQTRKRAGLLAGSLLLLLTLLSACSNPFGGSPTPKPTASTLPLSQIKWCSQPLMFFRDEGAYTPTPQPTATGTATATATATTTATAGATATASATASATATAKPAGSPTAGPGTPQTITSWSVVKANLGFTVYLPAQLPNGTCLVSAQATIHDPIEGGSFTIGYLFSNNTSLSISEAPLKSQNISFQCTGATTPTPGTTSTPTGTPATALAPSPTAIPTQLCSGAKSTTNIVISGPGTVSQLQQIFMNLQPNVNWIPAS